MNTNLILILTNLEERIRLIEAEILFMDDVVRYGEEYYPPYDLQEEFKKAIQSLINSDA